MSEGVRKIESLCPTEDLAAFIDGELSLARELEIDAHLAGCRNCCEELNAQKHFLCSLNSSLRAEADIELPADFTKHIVANAESMVSGLRRPKERYNAVFICAGLFLFVLFATGAEAGKLFQSVFGFFEQTAIVGGFFGHLVYSIFVGLVVVMRSVATQISYDAPSGLALAIFCCVAIILVSLRIIRVRGA